MSRATATFNVNVKTPEQGGGVITITPSSAQLPDETEGQQTSDQVAVVSVDGGVVLPLNYNFAGAPDGVSFSETDNGDGTFTIKTQGAPTAGDAAGSPYTIMLTVTDSAPLAARSASRVRVLR